MGTGTDVKEEFVGRPTFRSLRRCVSGEGEGERERKWEGETEREGEREREGHLPNTSIPFKDCSAMVAESGSKYSTNAYPFPRPSGS